MNVSLSACRIVRSRRRTMALQVRDGELVLHLPLTAGISAAELFLERHAAWAKAKLSEQLARQTPELKVEFGAKFPLFERNYPLRPGVRMGFDGAFFLPPEKDGDLAESLRKVYFSLAGRLLPAKVESRARELGIMVAGVRISSARRRWGSCSAKGTISLAWRLLLLPEVLCDYVIDHELAHRLELNHSPRFYAALERLRPGWRELRLQLRECGEKPDNWV
ncbi:MAG: M48 family metallopeptidase [Victivallaceae bacterium]|nr:SprT family zinc-dependent metalloprotease [Victivallaceae bacterium]